MPLEDRIFPDERAEELLQTEWSEGWAAQFLGTGVLTDTIVDQLNEMGAYVDQAGITLVFLERHRVELGLKWLLDCLGSPNTRSHRISTLLAETKTALAASEFEERDWALNELVGHAEIITLVDRLDPDSYSYRYPVDRNNRPVARPNFVDLRELHHEVSELCDSIYGIATELAERS